MPNPKWLCVTLLIVIACPLFGEPPNTDSELLGEVASAERSIDSRFDSISNVTGSTPLSLMGVTRGGYLKGFGAVFTLQIGLVAGANFGPFRQPTEDEKTKLNLSKRQRLEDLEIRARDILVEEGSRMSRVPVTENVALIISLFHHTWEDTTGLPSQLVMQAQRQILLDRQAGRIDLATFKSELDLARF